MKVLFGPCLGIHWDTCWHQGPTTALGACAYVVCICVCLCCACVCAYVVCVCVCVCVCTCMCVLVVCLCVYVILVSNEITSHVLCKHCNGNRASLAKLKINYRRVPGKRPRALNRSLVEITRWALTLLWACTTARGYWKLLHTALGLLHPTLVSRSAPSSWPYCAQHKRRCDMR